MRWGGDDAPSVRKPFSSVPRGCLGVPDPPAAAPPLEARSVAASCVWALGPPLLRLLRGRATTATRSRCLRLYLPWPAPPPSESGEGPAGPGPASVAGKRCAALLLRLRAGVCCRVCPFGLVREGGMPGWRRGGLSRPPGVARSSHASVESAALSVRSRLEFAAGGSALCAGTVGARLVLGGGAFPSGTRAPPPSPPARAGPGGRTDGVWWMAGGKPRRLLRGGLSFSEGRVCGSSAVWRWVPRGPRDGRKKGVEVLCAWGGVGPASRASRGRPVCLWRWDPRVVYPVGPLRSRRLASKSALSRSLRPGKPSPRVLRPQPLLNPACRDPLPGVTADAPQPPPPGWSSCRPRPENRPPAVRVSPLGPSPPPPVGVLGLVASLGRECFRGARGVVARGCVVCVSGRVLPGEENGGRTLGPLVGGSGAVAAGRWAAGGAWRLREVGLKVVCGGGGKASRRFPGFRGTVHGSVEGPLWRWDPALSWARRTDSLYPPPRSCSFLPFFLA